MLKYQKHGIFYLRFAFSPVEGSEGMGQQGEIGARDEHPHSLREIFMLFLRLGTTAFGGPAAHIAMMEDEVVRKRQWLTREDFLDLLSATNLIPGPNSTEMAIHIGHRRGGRAGLIVAGVSFIMPATVIVGVIAWGYMRYGKFPQAEGLLYGIRPVILMIVLQAIYRLFPSAMKSRLLVILGLAGLVSNLVGVNELVVLFGVGILSASVSEAFNRSKPRGSPMAGLLLILPGAQLAWNSAANGLSVTPFSLERLFWFFAKVGSVLFGSGYVLLAFLRADLVERWHWLTESQLLDAIAVGQITPGPVFTTATFIGYLLGGIPGAVLGTLGIFLPAFVFVALSGPLIPRLRKSKTAGFFLDGLNVASLALMAVVCLRMVRGTIVGVPALVVAMVSGVLLFRFKVNTTWLIVGGALAGILSFELGIQVLAWFW